MGWESFDVVRFDHGPFLRDQMRIAKSKVLINRFFLFLEVSNVKPSYRKSCAWNPFDMLRFELWPLFQGQMTIAKIKSSYNSLIRVSRGLHCHINLFEIMG